MKSQTYDKNNLILNNRSTVITYTPNSTRILRKSLNFPITTVNYNSSFAYNNSNNNETDRILSTTNTVINKKYNFNSTDQIAQNEYTKDITNNFLGPTKSTLNSMTLSNIPCSRYENSTAFPMSTDKVTIPLQNNIFTSSTIQNNNTKITSTIRITEPTITDNDISKSITKENESVIYDTSTIQSTLNKTSEATRTINNSTTTTEAKIIAEEIKDNQSTIINTLTTEITTIKSNSSITNTDINVSDAISTTCATYKDCKRIFTWETTAVGETRDGFRIIMSNKKNKNKDITN